MNPTSSLLVDDNNIDDDEDIEVQLGENKNSTLSPVADNKHQDDADTSQNNHKRSNNNNKAKYASLALVAVILCLLAVLLPIMLLRDSNEGKDDVAKGVSLGDDSPSPPANNDSPAPTNLPSTFEPATTKPSSLPSTTEPSLSPSFVSDEVWINLQDPFPGSTTTYVWDHHSNQNPNGTAAPPSSPFVLIIRNALSKDPDWQSAFRKSFLEWNATSDAIVLVEQNVTHDPDCTPVVGTLTVCNGDYGSTNFWAGQTELVVAESSPGRIIAATCRFNLYHLNITTTDDGYQPLAIQLQYTMCHELGHGLGLPHIDEDFFNLDQNNCMDYTSHPELNLSPGSGSIAQLETIYGIPETTTGPTTANPTEEPILVPVPTSSPGMTVPTSSPGTTMSPSPVVSPSPKPSLGPMAINPTTASPFDVQPSPESPPTMIPGFAPPTMTPGFGPPTMIPGFAPPTSSPGITNPPTGPTSAPSVEFLKDVYRWNGTTSGEHLTLTVLNALDEDNIPPKNISWQEPFWEAVTNWNASTVVSLIVKRVEPDKNCRSVQGVIKVCNGDYGQSQWRGLADAIVSRQQEILAVTVRINEYYVQPDYTTDTLRYEFCHELGHALGLPHTDENFFNEDLGNCLDYTTNPELNAIPGDINFAKLEALYG